jgi:hypothetical protein
MMPERRTFKLPTRQDYGKRVIGRFIEDPLHGPVQFIKSSVHPYSEQLFSGKPVHTEMLTRVQKKETRIRVLHALQAVQNHLNKRSRPFVIEGHQSASDVHAQVMLTYVKHNKLEPIVKKMKFDSSERKTISPQNGNAVSTQAASNARKRTIESYHHKGWKVVAREVVEKTYKDNTDIAEKASTTGMRYSEPQVGKVTGFIKALTALAKEKHMKKLTVTQKEYPAIGMAVTGIPLLGITVQRDVNGVAQKINGLNHESKNPPLEAKAVFLEHFVNAWNNKK